VAVIGDTVKLHVEFENFDNVLTDTSSIVLNIRDSYKKLIAGPFAVTDDYKIGTGIYEYPYVIPDGHSIIVCEFIGNPEGLPAVKRKTITCEWV
jgi:hypothetical protein